MMSPSLTPESRQCAHGYYLWVRFWLGMDLGRAENPNLFYSQDLKISFFLDKKGLTAQEKKN